MSNYQTLQKYSNLFAIDTNILIYAYNVGSPFHNQAQKFLMQKMKEVNEFDELPICICQQSCIEFVNGITWQRLENPLSVSQAINIIEYLNDCGLTIIHPKHSQVTTFSELVLLHNSRKKIFDTSIASTLKDNKIKGLYTVNVKDFQDYDFLTVINPLAE